MFGFVTAVCGAAVGAAATWWLRRRKEQEARAEQDRAALAADRAESATKFLERRIALRDQQLEVATKERDDYAEIAATHDVEPRQLERGRWVRKVWTARRYSGHPSQNLADLRRDIATFDGEHILLSLDIQLLGGWKRLLLGDAVDDSPAKATTPLSTGQAMVFEGPIARVLAQLETFLLDDDTGLLGPRDLGTPADPTDAAIWRDTDSPMIWLLTVDVLQGGGDPPPVQVVEVLRIQQELVEKVVERPVVRAVPREITDKLCGHTSEEIISLIEAVLEVRELDRDARINGELRALGNDRDGTKALRATDE